MEILSVDENQTGFGASAWRTKPLNTTASSDYTCDSHLHPKAIALSLSASSSTSMPELKRSGYWCLEGDSSSPGSPSGSTESVKCIKDSTDNSESKYPDVHFELTKFSQPTHERTSNVDKLTMQNDVEVTTCNQLTQVTHRKIEDTTAISSMNLITEESAHKSSHLQSNNNQFYALKSENFDELFNRTPSQNNVNSTEPQENALASVTMPTPVGRPPERLGIPTQFPSPVMGDQLNSWYPPYCDRSVKEQPIPDILHCDPLTTSNYLSGLNNRLNMYATHPRKYFEPCDFNSSAHPPPNQEVQFSRHSPNSMNCPMFNSLAAAPNSIRSTFGISSYEGLLNTGDLENQINIERNANIFLPRGRQLLPENGEIPLPQDIPSEQLFPLSMTTTYEDDMAYVNGNCNGGSGVASLPHWDSGTFSGPYGLHNGSPLEISNARRRNATRESTATLKTWLREHIKNPYPTKGEKIMLAIITKMNLTQVSTWFANARRRLKKENKMTWAPKNRSENMNDDTPEGREEHAEYDEDSDGDEIGEEIRDRVERLSQTSKESKAFPVDGKRRTEDDGIAATTEPLHKRFDRGKHLRGNIHIDDSTVQRIQQWERNTLEFNVSATKENAVVGNPELYCPQGFEKSNLRMGDIQAGQIMNNNLIEQPSDELSRVYQKKELDMEYDSAHLWRTSEIQLSGQFCMPGYSPPSNYFQQETENNNTQRNSYIRGLQQHNWNSGIGEPPAYLNYLTSSSQNPAWMDSCGAELSTPAANGSSTHFDRHPTVQYHTNGSIPIPLLRTLDSWNPRNPDSALTCDSQPNVVVHNREMMMRSEQLCNQFSGVPSPPTSFLFPGLPVQSAIRGNEAGKTSNEAFLNINGTSRPCTIPEATGNFQKISDNQYWKSYAADLSRNVNMSKDINCIADGQQGCLPNLSTVPTWSPWREGTHDSGKCDRDTRCYEDSLSQEYQPHLYQPQHPAAQQDSSSPHQSSSNLSSTAALGYLPICSPANNTTNASHELLVNN